MKNLAGSVDCDNHIERELKEAGIKAVTVQKTKREVPYTVIGMLGLFEDKHNNGTEYEFDAQYDALARMNNNTEELLSKWASFTFHRGWRYWIVKGCVQLPVAEKLYELDKDKVIRVAGHAGAPEPKEWVNGVKVCGYDVVETYHIDTQEGLNLFVKTLQEYNLV